MSAPDSNIKKQTRRHSGALLGIAVAVVAGVLAIGIWLVWAVSEGNTPREATPEGGVIAPAGN